MTPLRSKGGSDRSTRKSSEKWVRALSWVQLDHSVASRVDSLEMPSSSAARSTACVSVYIINPRSFRPFSLLYTSTGPGFSLSFPPSVFILLLYRWSFWCVLSVCVHRREHRAPFRATLSLRNISSLSYMFFSPPPPSSPLFCPQAGGWFNLKQCCFIKWNIILQNHLCLWCYVVHHTSSIAAARPCLWIKAPNLANA